MKEFYALDDLIKNALPTSSNGKLIETGGSIYLNATENNNKKKQVKINPSIGVAIDFTIGKDDPEMEVFVKDPRYTNQVNWILPRAKRSSSIKKSWQMTETIYNADKTIRSEQVFHSKEEWEAHLQKRKEEKEQKRKEEEIKQVTKNKMDSKLKIYNLGYINCDKFYNEPMTPFIVAADQKTIAEYYLVFKDVRGVMKGKLYNQQVNFGSVPKNKQATLVAVSFIDKQAYFFNSSINISSSEIPTIILKPVEESFLNQQLALLK
ncbi:MAG: hypothetical protein JKX68_01120 [Flavobacteriales bacterium]|nr:hypothetical protein [Flavobacteriales bacterium]